MTAGNLGRDLNSRKSTALVAGFSIAARTGKDETTWIDCSVWGKRRHSELPAQGDITVAG